MELEYAMGRGRKTLPIAVSHEPTVSNINRRDVARYEPGGLETSKEQVGSAIEKWVGAA
jgi:hypothetical protein